MKSISLIFLILFLPLQGLAEDPTISCTEHLAEVKVQLSIAEQNLQVCQWDKDAYEQAFIDMHIAYVEHIFNEYYPALEKIAVYKKEIRRLKRELKRK